MLALFLLLFSISSKPAVAASLAVTTSGWKCPNTTISVDRDREVHCHCEIPHTLRCDGVLESGSRRSQILRKLVREVADVPDDEAVTLLDISVKNISKLPGKLFQNVGLELSGLVISTGSLVSLDKKAFFGLEKMIRALGLPDNKLTKVPVDSLEILSLLTRLDLSENRITSIAALPRLPELEYLDLSHNNLSVLAGGWALYTPNLRTLVLSGNHLNFDTLTQHSPGHLTYLTALDLGQNQLTGNVTNARMSQLCPAGVKTLDMSFNGVKGIKSQAFTRLTALSYLYIQGNKLELIEDLAFSGLESLVHLDLSHNNILSLAPRSLDGLINLQYLSLSHNYLQTVSSTWLGHVSGLKNLFLMDNDISRVEDGALDKLKNITEINFSGNQLDCDCQINYLFTWLQMWKKNLNSKKLSSSPSNASSNLSEKSSVLSAVCATPPKLTNARVYELSMNLDCDTWTRDSSTSSSDIQDYYYTYEYYHDNSTESSFDAFLLSTKEVQFVELFYDQHLKDLTLTFSINEDVKHYQCDLIQIFDEAMDIQNMSIPCNVKPSFQKNSSLVSVSFNLDQYGLCSNEVYTFCVTFLQGGQVMPGCTGPVLPSRATESQMPLVSISSLHGNVSLTHNMTVHVAARVPSSMLSSSHIEVSVSQPADPPVLKHQSMCVSSLSETKSEDGNLFTSDKCHKESENFKYCNVEAILSDLPEYTYYNVCAELHVADKTSPNHVVDSQCMILHSSTVVRYQNRSVLSLMLTLIFLCLGIACLTVLYLIVKARGSRPWGRPRPRGNNTCLLSRFSMSFSYWWRVTAYRRNKLVDEFSDDEQ